MLSLRNFFNKKSIKKKKTESFFDCLLPIDKQNIIQITKQEATLDQITKQVEKKKKLLEVEIRTIQKSTRTTNPIFIKAHNKLRAKYNWYYKWHIWPQHEKIHSATLTFCLIIASFAIFHAFTTGIRPSLAAGTPVISNIDPNSGTALGGTNVTISGSNFETDPGIGSGGTVTTSGAYTIHTFTGDGTFSVPSSRNVEVMVVGGGGGGAGTFGGGGGAGGLIYNATFPVDTQSYSITAGAGGDGGYDDADGSNGFNSIFSSLTAVGGGGGAYYRGTCCGVSGKSGGSGGGGAAFWSGSGGSPTAGQGNAGGGGGSGLYFGGGGGGAGAGGLYATGGVGLPYSISGSSVYYAGGGGGGGYSGACYSGPGGTGGGGAGTCVDNVNGTAGTTNRGGGGGGGGGNPPATHTTGGKGGSGIVIIKYLTVSAPSITFGDISATNITVINTTTITATTPAHAAGIVDVSITSSSGSSTLNNGFTYIASPSISGISPSSGSKNGGDNINLTGTAFYGSPTVTMGGIAATSVVLVNSTTITATTPAHLIGQVDVVVTNPDAQSVTLTNGFTYTEPIPTITSISPNAGSTAGGTNVTITGTNFVQEGGLATGGTITTNGAYTVHTFTTGGTFSVPTARNVEVLVVGGGGSGGTYHGGGGGAGGLVYNSSFVVSTGNKTVTVGNGGTSVNNTSSPLTGNAGQSSVFSTITASGGGGGGSNSGGLSGGSGGGGGVPSTDIIVAGGSGTSLQGNNGGSGSRLAAGGGGGAGTVGQNGQADGTNYGGNGGIGVPYSISGTAKYYAGGGGGIGWSRIGSGGNGGGGDGSVLNGNAVSGTANTGGGGGGASVASGDGGSGIVIVRYLTSAGTSITFGGVAATNVTVVNSTTITATTPAHAAGAVNIVATNPDTTTGTLSNGFTYNAAPTLSGASPSSGSKTGGDAVTLTGTNFYGTPTVTVGGTTATNIVVVNSTTITMTTPAHAVGQVNIVVTNSDTQLATLTNGFTYTDTYNLVSSAGGNGSISPNGITNVASGGSQAYTITPILHYHVLDVLVDSVSQGAITTYTFNSVSTSHTISATFTIDTFNITASGGANGSISPNGVTTVNYNGSQTYTIAADLHYHILDVLVDSISQGTIGSYTFNNVSAIHTISATFAIDTYNITASGGANGSISPNGATSVDYNNSQAYTITPIAHYHIVDVLIDSVSQGTISSYTFNSVSTSHTISATFAIDTYLVSMSKAGSGTGSLDQTTGAFDYGSNLSIIATSDISSNFISWVGCSSVNGNICYLTNLAAQQTITATFDIKTFIVTVSKTGSGSGSFSNETTTVNYGSSFSTTLSPDSNSNFISFIVCPIPSVNTCNITNIVSDQSVIAQIELKPVINNIINENNQSISAVKTNSSTITINIAPNNTATEMEFSNSSDFLGATYEPIALTKTWTLSSPDINGVKTIYYRVKDQYGNESPISSMTITLDIQAPSAPTNLTVSPGINSISLSWDNPTDADFAKVVIFRSTNPNFVPVIDNNVSHYDEILNNKIGETANRDIRTFVDTNVIDGVVYYYLIEAIDDIDNFSSPNPPLMTGTSTQSPFEPNSNLIVEKPTEETLEILNIAVKVSETENKTIQATITWETSGSATSEVNYGKTTDYEELSIKDDNLSLFHTITLNNLGFNTTYHFKVTSKNINGGLASSTDNNFTTGTVSEERPDEKSALNMFISNLTDQMVKIRDIFIVSAEQVTAAVKNTNLFISNATNISEAAVPAVASSIAVSVATVAAVAAPVANAMTVFSFPEYLKAIFYSILSLSARKKRKDWGKVVEAKTGIPIAQAKIDLIKIEKIQNEEKDLRTVVASTYSEKDGSYAFIADPGQYKIAVEKDMFFLSEEPGFYNSEIITVKNETDSLIVPSIALSMSKNETKKKLHSLQNLTIFEKVIFYVALAFLIVGTLTAISGFLKNPGSTYSIITLCLYPFLWYLSIKSMLKVSPFGQVEDATNHKGVPLALLRIMDPTGNKLIKTAVTNEEGKYKTLIDKGNYKVLISKDGYKQMKPIELLVTKKISSVNKIIELEEE